jgi:hypothetical protein
VSTASAGAAGEKAARLVAIVRELEGFGIGCSDFEGREFHVVVRNLAQLSGSLQGIVLVVVEVLLISLELPLEVGAFIVKVIVKTLVNGVGSDEEISA